VKKTAYLRIRLDSNLKAKLARAAKEDGRSLSDMARRILKKWLDENREPLHPN
jgi:antitoxin component of RelBE/YafQ-DinJ toxin-antitoxin module